MSQLWKQDSLSPLWESKTAALGKGQPPCASLFICHLRKGTENSFGFVPFELQKTRSRDLFSLAQGKFWVPSCFILAVGRCGETVWVNTKPHLVFLLFQLKYLHFF